MDHCSNKLKKSKTAQRGLTSLALLALLFFQGCATISSPYVEQHEIDNLTIVFMDVTSLQAEWERVTGQEAVRFIPRMGGGSPPVEVRTIQGFYDFRTNTLYCTKWDFHVCGHELHHAVLGHFHPNR